MPASFLDAPFGCALPLRGGAAEGSWRGLGFGRACGLAGVTGLRPAPGLEAAGFFGVAIGRRGIGLGFAALGLPVPFALPLPSAELPADGGEPGGRGTLDWPELPDFPGAPRVPEDFEPAASEPLRSAGRAVVVVVSGGPDVTGLGPVTAGAGASCSAWFGSVMPTAL